MSTRTVKIDSTTVPYGSRLVCLGSLPLESAHRSFEVALVLSCVRFLGWRHIIEQAHPAISRLQFRRRMRRREPQMRGRHNRSNPILEF